MKKTQLQKMIDAEAEKNHREGFFSRLDKIDSDLHGFTSRNVGLRKIAKELNAVIHDLRNAGRLGSHLDFDKRGRFFVKCKTTVRRIPIGRAA